MWVESYRPNSVAGYVFQHEDQKQQVESWIKDKSIPHLLLSGAAGTGKTTLAKLLIKNLGIHQYDILEANGSKEARKIEWVDTLIGSLDSFVKASYPDLRKCLNSLQQNSATGVLVKPKGTTGDSSDYKLAVVDLFKTGKIREARKLLCSQVAAEQMEDFFRWSYDNLSLWSKTEEGQDEAILVIRKGLLNHALIADPEINLAATLVELSQIGK